MRLKFKSACAAAILILGAVFSGPSRAGLIVNGSFETPSFDPNNTGGTYGQCQTGSATASFEGCSYIYDPTAAGVGWTFNGGAGVALAWGGSPWYSGAGVDGANVAFLQTGGSVSQTITATAGTVYDLSFLLAERSGYGEEDVELLVNGQLVHTFVDSYSTLTSVSASFEAASTSETIELLGVDVPQGQDDDAIIDDVSLTDIPEPLSAALLVVGMTAVGVAARRRRRAA